MTGPLFTPGRNIAMKLPVDVFDQTVSFYETVLGWSVEAISPGTARTVFGGGQLWFDRVEGLSQAQIWLELNVEEYETARAYLLAHGTQDDPSIEPLPVDFRGFWIRNPAGLVHLIAEPGQDG